MVLPTLGLPNEVENCGDTRCFVIVFAQISLMALEASAGFQPFSPHGLATSKLATGSKCQGFL